MITFQSGRPDYYFPPFTKPIWIHMDYIQFISLLAKQALHLLGLPHFRPQPVWGNFIWGRQPMAPDMD